MANSTLNDNVSQKNKQNMILLTSWMIKLGGGCIDGGKHDGFCKKFVHGKKISTPPSFDNDDVSIVVDEKEIAVKQIAIEVDENKKYGIVSEIPSELAFKSAKHCNGEIMELSKIIIKNNRGECISVETILSFSRD